MQYRLIWLVCAVLAVNTNAKSDEFCAGKNVIELVQFTLHEGVSAEVFKVSSIEVEKELSKLPGFERRQILLNEAGEWVDIVYWRNMSQAKLAAEKMQTNPVAGEFFDLIAADSVVMSYYCE